MSRTERRLLVPPALHVPAGVFMSFFPPIGSGSHPCSTATKLVATCPQYTLQPAADYEVESDIVDQCFDLIDGEQEEIPQRPSSRLGFHSELPECYATDTEDPSETTHPKMTSGSIDADSDNQDSIDLASSFSLMTYDMGEDITTVASSHCLQDDLLRPLPPRHISLKIKVPENCGRANTSLSDDESDFADSESSSDCSYDSSDDYFDFSPTAPTSPPADSYLYAPSLVAPVARLPSSPSYVPLESVEPPSAASVRTPSHKLSHHNHGYSKHALHHIKSFWIMREGKRADYDTEQRDSNTYNGLANLGQPSHSDGPDPIRSHTQRNLTHRLKMKSPVPRGSALPPMSIHPRRGDIAALRDPFCAHIDRCFVSLPSWTLAKTLYMFDVHVGYEWQNRRAASIDGPSCSDSLQQKCSSATTDSLDDVDAESESESLGTSASVASSDDSDATLVESENEGELEREDYSAFESFMSNAGPSSPSSSSENDQNTPRLKCSSSHFEHASPKCPISPILYEQMRSPRAEFFCILDDDVESMTPWATNWYRRWEILMELVRFNWGQDQFFAALDVNEQRFHAGQPSPRGSAVDGSAERKGKRRLKRQPRFFFADDNTVDEDDTSWEWDLTFDLNSKAKISEPTFGLGHKAEGSIPL